ncbi:MAG: energy transducer TonB, partial [Alphaproteobacteria bacterium]|nr:energy transducer TonB [Alphaproteobacteria bacterium]
MAKADFSTPRPLRFGLIVLIALIHLGVFLGLMRAFAPGVVDKLVDKVTSAIFVTVPTPTPTPTPTARPSAAPEQGAEGAAGRRAKPREETAPEARIVVSEKPAPRASSTGTENRSGVSEAGEGTGAGNQGTGTGAGGQGALAAKAVKIAGDIKSARDYPRKTRDLRIGASVVIVLTVGTDGKPRACRVARASPDPEADRIT